MAKQTSTRTVRPGSFVAGLVLATLALFMFQATLRQVFVALHRSQYVRDEFEFEYYSESDTGSTLGGHVVSNGEHFAIAIPLIPLKQLRELEQQSKIAGFRAPVWYLPQAATWSRADAWLTTRVMPPAEFELSGTFRAVVVLVNLAMAVGAILMIRRGVGRRPAGATNETP